MKIFFMDKFHIFAIFLNFCIYAKGKLPQCLTQTCEFPDNTTDPYVYSACEQQNNAFANVASIADIKVEPENATCGRPPVKICSLQNYLSCPYICDVRNEDNSHGPMRMVDGIKWTWWQSKPFNITASKDFGINITISLPKVFVLTDDIIIEFFDGYPDAMIVEKSLDHGNTWSIMEYFSSNCMRQFGMKKYVTSWTEEEAFSPICTEKYSVNRDGLATGGVTRVAVGKRLRDLSLLQITEDQICDKLYKDSILKRFLEITNLRIRLIRPPVLSAKDEAISNHLPLKSTSGHYGIKKVQIFARCQCNGHAGECLKEDGNMKCQCRHNTYGSECEKCKTLFWMRPWKSANYVNTMKKQANPCLSFYSKHFRQRWLKRDPFHNKTMLSSIPVPSKCSCNGHSERCELMNKMTMCVDCRHNTEGQNCHRCRTAFYRNVNKNISHHSSRTCQECQCDRFGSLVSWCHVSGRCRCMVLYKGRRCNHCASGYHRIKGGRCQRVQENPSEKAQCCRILCRKKYCENWPKSTTELELLRQRPNPVVSCDNISLDQCSCGVSDRSCWSSSGTRAKLNGNGQNSLSTNTFIFYLFQTMIVLFTLFIFSGLT